MEGFGDLRLPRQPLADRILMGAGEGGEDQLPGVGGAGMDWNAGNLFDEIDDIGQAGEIESRLHTARFEVQREGDQIHIAGAFAVAEQCSFDPFGSGQHRHFGGGDRPPPGRCGV